MPHVMQAQCYTFNGSNGGTFASLTISVTSLGSASSSPDGNGGYIYTYSGVSSNNTLVVGGSSVTSSGVGTIALNQNPDNEVPDPVYVSSMYTSVDFSGTEATVAVDGVGNLFPTGLAAVFPPIQAWNVGTSSDPDPDAAMTIGSTTYNLTSITSDCGPPPPPKSNGCNCAGAPVGDPINPATGNVFESKNDYSTAGQNSLSFSRYYNSMAIDPGTFALELGGWRSNYDRYLHIEPASSPTTVIAERADGQAITFTLSGSTWVTDSDVDYTLTQGSTWTLTDPDDTVETYSDSGTGEGLLSTIKLRNGYTQTLTYSSGLLSGVTDSYSRSLGFTYSGGLLTKVTTPDSTSTGITFAYNSNGVLSTVTYPTSPSTTLTYVYENTSLPMGLTGIIDENGNRYATWAYDSLGRATSNQMGGSLAANLTTLTYNSGGTTTVTNAFGVADTYTFSTLQGTPKVSGISRAATSSTAAATKSFTYDSNGYLATVTDWNGNETKYTNNGHGLPTSIIEAYGSSVARTTSITYDSSFVHLPDSIATSGVTTSFTYQSGTGNVLTRTETDTTTGSTPYSTNGTARTWTNTWGTGSNVGLLLTVTGPLTGQTTTFAYSGGILTSITDPLSHVTTINTSTPGGLPTKITDPNSVVSTFTYDGRQRRLTATVDTSAGNLTTTYTYDSAGNLTKTTLPDGSYLSTTFDNAHRPTKITNANGEYVSFTLDALGDRTASNIYTSGGTEKRAHSASFDALGRMLTDVGGVSGETTTFAYDKNGNPTSIKDGRSHTTTKTYDALNRLSQTTDRASGVTTTAYDAHNQVTSVTDPRSHVTSYTRDGFERIIQTVSPDSGTTVNHYDLADNLTKKVDGASVETDHTYDKLNRELTRSFPGDSSENVSKTYDQSGTISGFTYGFGVGRLTSQTDQAGSVKQQYDERGNMLHRMRLEGSIQTDLYDYYDNASRVSAYENPSQWSVKYLRDSAGQVTEIDILAPGVYTGGTAVVSSVTHLPFGPVSGFSYANGINRTTTYDLDYRQTLLKDAATATVQNLTYAYDNNSNVTGITDSVTASNSQTIIVDNLDRITSATSGSGGYGSLSWTYDATDNRLTEVTNGSTNTYTYGTGNNQIATQTPNSTNYTFNGAGEMTKTYFGSYLDLTYAFDQSQRLYTPTYSGYGSPSSYALYDDNGIRQSKSSTVFHTFTTNVDNRLIEEGTTVGQVTDYIYLDGMPVAQLGLVTSGGTTTETTYYVHSDRLGTPQLVTDGSKTTQWHATYLPFGAATLVTNNITQSLRFPGQYYDSETGLYYNNARDYDPTTGRYIEIDQWGLNGGSINIYTYARMNPFRFIDPTGLNWTISTYGPIGITNPFGHTGIGASYPFQNSPTIGYYPANSPAAFGPGVLQPDTEYNPGAGFNLQTDALQDLLIESYLQGLGDSPPDYNAFTSNCAQQVGNALTAAGFPVPNSIFTPEQLQDWLQQYQPYTPIPQMPSVPTPVPQRSRPDPNY